MFETFVLLYRELEELSRSEEVNHLANNEYIFPAALEDICETGLHMKKE